MQQEIDSILKLMVGKQEEKYTCFKFIIGKIKNRKCVVCLCGVGKVNAAACTQTLIIKYQPDFILNIGIAGSTKKDVNIGDIVVADYVIQHDFDVSMFQNRKKGEIPGINAVKIPCAKWFVQKVFDINPIIDINIHIGTILSGDQFINSKVKINQILKNFDGLACEMEAGAIGQTCFINKIDFGVIRSISDSADENSTIDFKKFTNISAEKTAKFLMQYL